jgi:murein DD-endopeptidase MepM/ murein hydrolase activator NlpD
VVLSAAGIAGVCAAGLIPTQAAGQSDRSISEQVAEAADDLAQANKKVNEVTAALTSAQAQLDDAQERVDAATARGAEADEVAARARDAVAQAEAAIHDIETQISATRARVSRLRTEIGSLARQIYTSGGSFDEIQIVLDSQDPAEFTARLAAIGRVSQGNGQILDRLATVKHKLDEQLNQSQILQDRADARRAEADQKAQEAAAATQTSRAARAEVAIVVAKKKRIVASANSQRGAVGAQYSQLRDEQQRIARKIRQALERERREEAERRRREAARKPSSSKPANPGRPTTPSKPKPTRPTSPSRPGTLSWPLPGHSAGGRTGSRVHPIYGYSSCHTGDDIGASSGTPIRSAADGYVLSVEYGGPYGKHTVISHGGGLSTMYAHQSDFNVYEGQRVRRGQVIGYVGSTGYSTGPHLHFEVHVDGVPWEPMGWFGGSKYRVSCA